LNLRASDVSTHSMTLSWTPPIKLNPIGYKISFNAVKEFRDSQGVTQLQMVPTRVIELDKYVLSHTIDELSPFISYAVNVSAVPSDRSYRPPSRITVTTQMAAPQPMVKPDFFGVVNMQKIHVSKWFNRNKYIIINFVLCFILGYITSSIRRIWSNLSLLCSSCSRKS
jgi:receptor-type tyrosine-protein phosphatase F